MKAHPIERDDTSVSIIPGRADAGFGRPTGIPAFGGGTSVRGPGGRFIKPSLYRPAFFIPDRLVAKTEIRLPDVPEHAKWVHNGTGIYGPRKSVITAHKPGGFMTFPTWSKAVDRRPNWRLRSVKGQKAQPYLNDAYLLINRTYIPARLQLLDAQIAAAT